MAESLADKVEWLFQHVPDPESGQPFTNPRLAARIRRLRPGFSVTGTAIWNVRTGVTTRPSWQLMEGMAKAFRVAPGFFSADGTIHDLEQQLAALAVLRDTKLWNLAERAQGVSSEGVDMAVDVAMVVLERYRELEGLESLNASTRPPTGHDRSPHQQHSMRHSRGTPSTRKSPAQGPGLQ